MSHTCMGHVAQVNEHVTHMSESRRINMNHVTHVNQPCRTYESVMSPVYMSHVTQTWSDEFVSWHAKMSHATHMNETCNTAE